MEIHQGHRQRRRTLYQGLDISQPLCRGCVVTLANGEKSWVSFKYKLLSNFYYWCGCMTHDDKDCELWIQSKGPLKSDQQQFGPWLKVALYQTASKDVIFLPGYYENHFPRNKERKSVVEDRTVVAEKELGTTMPKSRESNMVLGYM